ncbi:MAG TPA: NF038122 family metalloprotease, partial [Magnetospirillaceae bacterium]|nr:NF038122 family metalloprotease [Magnetospirillaceae bacterium]
MYVNVTFDSSVANAPTGFKACVNAVCQYYDAMFTNAVSISVDVGWGEVAGQTMGAGALGESNSYYVGQSYARVAGALRAQNAPGSSTLPQTSPAAGTLQVTTAEALALGLGNFGQGIDGAIGIDASASWFVDPTQSKAVPFRSYDMMGVIEHELSEVMGRSSNLNQSGAYSVLDLYRYASAGARQLTTGAPSY